MPRNIFTDPKSISVNYFYDLSCLVFLEYDYSYRIHLLMACYAFSAVVAHYLLAPLSYGKVFVYVSQVLR